MTDPPPRAFSARRDLAVLVLLFVLPTLLLLIERENLSPRPPAPRPPEAALDAFEPLTDEAIPAETAAALGGLDRGSTLSRASDRLNEALSIHFSRGASRWGRFGKSLLDSDAVRVGIDPDQRDRLAVYDRKLGGLRFGMRPLLARLLENPWEKRAAAGLDDDAASRRLFDLLEHAWTRRPFIEEVAPLAYPLLVRAALAGKARLPRETLEEETAVRLSVALRVRVLLSGENPDLLRLGAYDALMRKRLGQPPAEGAWWRDPLPPGASHEKIAEEGMAARETSGLGLDREVPELWLDLRASAAGVEALRESIGVRYPELDRLSQDWDGHLEALRAEADQKVRSTALEGSAQRRESITREVQEIEAHVASDRVLAADPDRVRRARHVYRDEIWAAGGMIEEAPALAWDLAGVGDRLSQAYTAVFTLVGPMGREAANRLRTHDVLLEVRPGPADRLAVFHPASGEIRVGIVPFLRRYGLSGIPRTPEAAEVAWYSNRLVDSWQEPGALQAFASETAPVVFHELAHASLASRVALPLETMEEELSARMRTVLFIRERLRADPEYLGLRAYDAVMREALGEASGREPWWTAPLSVEPSIVVESALRRRLLADGSFHPHTPTLWLDLRLAAGGAQPLRDYLKRLGGLDALDQDWGKRARRLEKGEQRRSVETMLRAPGYLQRARAWYAAEISTLESQLLGGAAPVDAGGTPVLQR